MKRHHAHRFEEQGMMALQRRGRVNGNQCRVPTRASLCWSAARWQAKSLGAMHFRHQDGHQKSEVFMSVGETRYEYVVLDEEDGPVIAGTNMKVIELVLEKMAYGWSPEELHFQHPYLTLGQIYSALAYYWDHQEELDRDIERRLRFVDQVQRAMGPSPLVARLKAKSEIKTHKLPDKSSG